MIWLTATDLHKVFVDDIDYKDVGGELYATCGVDPKDGAIVIVRPDQCKFPYSTAVYRF